MFSYVKVLRPQLLDEIRLAAESRVSAVWKSGNAPDQSVSFGAPR
jgi:hypothetical protein